MPPKRVPASGSGGAGALNIMNFWNVGVLGLGYVGLSMGSEIGPIEPNQIPAVEASGFRVRPRNLFWGLPRFGVPWGYLFGVLIIRESYCLGSILGSQNCRKLPFVGNLESAGPPSSSSLWLVAVAWKVPGASSTSSSSAFLRFRRV